ncbi:MAG: YkgJ family cysteine cluster protein [Candidatus Omnitrophica bacterium]|nr:YkgJ family cysteine cluster protein [Candidatus Omnitrophota bacterium]
MIRLEQFVESKFCLKGCTYCCRYNCQDSIWAPYITEEEIKFFLKNDIPIFEFIDVNKRIHPVYPPLAEMHRLNQKERIRFICPFLDLAKNACKIYPFRPFECRLYPFLINRRKNKVFLAVDLNCPFVQQNRSSPRFKDYINYLNDFFSRSRYLKTLKDNLQLIHNYKGPEDIVELKID